MMRTDFGWIEIDGKRYEHDVVVYPDGKVEKRRKEISKMKHGTSHMLDMEEIVWYLGHGEKAVVIGSGQYGLLDLTEEARKLLEDRKVEIYVLPTPEAIKKYEELRGKKPTLGIFHVTCRFPFWSPGERSGTSG